MLVTLNWMLEYRILLIDNPEQAQEMMKAWQISSSS
jgi:hypothetical protein